MPRASSRPFRRFVAAVLGVFVLLMAGNYGLFRLKMGGMTRGTAQRCVNVAAKIDRVGAIPSPKLVFIGGSAVHKGINAEAVGKVFGLRGGNLGTMAALGPPVLLWNARKVLRRGDTAVLVLEYDLYWHDRPTDPEIDYVLGCGADFFAQLTPVAQAPYILGASPIRLLRGRTRNLASLEQEAAQRMSAAGDALPTAAAFPPIDAEQRERMRHYTPHDLRFAADSRDVRAVAAFIAWARVNGIRVIATWPNTVYFDDYRRRADRFASIAAFYRTHGVPVAGDPLRTMFPVEAFHDTQYHLGYRGIQQRTAITIADLRPLLGSDPARR